MADLKPAILGHAEFQAFNQQATKRFTGWRTLATGRLKAFGLGDHPKTLIATLAEELLSVFAQAPLLDAYDIYQHLMDYWAQTMQDDAYVITVDGWVARTRRILETDKKGRTKDRGWTCELIPKPLIVARYFAEQRATIDALQVELDAAAARQTELEEEQGGDEGVFAGYDGIAAAAVKERIREIGSSADGAEELKLLRQWLDFGTGVAALKKEIRDADAALDVLAYEKYPKLSQDEIQSLVIDNKWMATLAASVQDELDRVSRTLTGRIRELTERYGTPLPRLADEVVMLNAKVEANLAAMGVLWK